MADSDQHDDLLVSDLVSFAVARSPVGCLQGRFKLLDGAADLGARCVGLALGQETRGEGQQEPECLPADRHGCLTVVRHRTPDQVADLGGDLTPQGVSDMLLAGCHRFAGPAHEGHDRRRRLAQDQKHGRGCVPGIVEPRVTVTGVLKRTLPFAVVSPRVDRLAGLRGKDPAFLVPELPGCGPLAFLLAAVRAEQGDELRRRADGTASRLGLDAVGGCPGGGPLRASARRLAARAVAAVGIPRPQPGPAHSDAAF
jgi:hypothetical protein